MKPEIKERIDKIKRGEMPDGYKTSKIGVIPEDWDVKHLEDISNINPRKEVLDENDTVSFISMSDVSDDARLISYQPRLYKEVFKGFTAFRDKDVLVAKITPCFENGKGALVDNLINKTGFGSTEFHVLRSKKNGDELFIYYHTVTDRFRKIGKKNMTGTAGQKRISTDFVKGFLIPYPRNDIERKKIASILSTWDKAIELKEKLIEQKKQQKKGLMQKLLTGEVRLPGFYGEWEKVSFSDIFIKTKVKKHQIKTNEYLESGKYPVVDQGQKKVTAYSNDEEKVFEVPETGVIVFGDHTREIKFIDFDFIIGADGTQVLMTKDDYDVRFYYYHLLIQKIPNTGYNRHFKFLKEMIFNKPSLKEQKAISNLLSTIDKELDLLNAELSALNEQKKGLMQLLLTGKVRVKV